MRLLEASSVQLVDFTPDKVPPYAILSHRWQEDEALFADFINDTAGTKAKSYEKIKATCKQAAQDGLQYVWIDTCCIDKSSSAELSEAINSMWAWYQAAQKCYAFLSDVSFSGYGDNKPSALRESEWFRRGWTLQELLGPFNVVFFSKEWFVLGYRDDRVIAEVVSNVTGIDEEFLTRSSPIEAASVAKRMSWAANRSTTRPEDMAYCLMGLFSVNMPMLYGEGGERAFLRLQEEIMKQSDDQSLFAWIDPNAHLYSYHGLLAKSPENFAASGDVISYQDGAYRSPYSMTNMGLRIDLQVCKSVVGNANDAKLFVALNCVPADRDNTFLAICLEQLPQGDQQYARIDAGRFHYGLERGKAQTIYVRQAIRSWNSGAFSPSHVMILRTGPSVRRYRASRMLVFQSVQPLKTGITGDEMTNVSHKARQWVKNPMPIAFLARKEADKLAAAIFFNLDSDKRLVVMLGSMTAHWVGFDAHIMEGEVADKISFPLAEELFRPKYIGRPIKVKDYVVGVHYRNRVFQATKYFVIDVDIHTVE